MKNAMTIIKILTEGKPVIDNNDNILLNKRLKMPDKMVSTNKKILNLLKFLDGREISQSELINAIMEHQKQVKPSEVVY